MNNFIKILYFSIIISISLNATEFKSLLKLSQNNPNINKLKNKYIIDFTIEKQNTEIKIKFKTKSFSKSGTNLVSKGDTWVKLITYIDGIESPNASMYINSTKKQIASKIFNTYIHIISSEYRSVIAKSKQGREQEYIFSLQLREDSRQNKPNIILAYKKISNPDMIKNNSSTNNRFELPTLNGYRVDWCTNYATGCGKSSADTFCQTKGFSQSESWSMAKNIGDKTPTKTQGDKKICKESYCDGFKFIKCSNKSIESKNSNKDNKQLKTKVTKLHNVIKSLRKSIKRAQAKCQKDIVKINKEMSRLQRLSKQEKEEINFKQKVAEWKNYTTIKSKRLLNGECPIVSIPIIRTTKNGIILIK